MCIVCHASASMYNPKIALIHNNILHTLQANKNKQTIIILDSDACLFKVWSHYYSWMATRISKRDLELFVSLHNEVIYHSDFKLDTGLPSRDSHLFGESISREIDTGCE